MSNPISTASPPWQQNKKRYKPFMSSTWMLCMYLAVIVACFVIVELVIARPEEVSELRYEDHAMLRRGVSITTMNNHNDTTPSTYIPLTSSTESTYTITLPGAPYPTSELTIATQSTSAIETGAPPPNSLLTITNTPSAPLPSSQLKLTSTSSQQLNGAPAIQSELTLSGPLTKVDYVLGLYLPKVVAVVLQSLWSITFASIKMMEPFYRLGHIQGSSAEASLLSDYLTTGLTSTFVSSFFDGRWILVCASITYVIMTFMITLVSEAFAVKSLGVCQNNQPCDPAWVIEIPMAHAVQALLALLCFLILITAFLTMRRQSPIYHDPSSIAAVASLLGHPPLMEDLRFSRALASKSEIKSAFRSHRYILSQYTDTNGNQRYGIVKIDDSQITRVEEQFDQKGYQPVSNPLDPNLNKSSNSRTALARSTSYKDLILDMFLFTGTAGLFSIVLAYYVIGQSASSFNVFMNSSSFGPRFILSGLATLISIGLKRVEKSTRMLEVYRRMSSSPQHARKSVLASQAGTPFTSVFVSLYRGQFFVSWVAFVTILSEILIIAVSGVPYGTAQTSGLYIGSTYVSIIILALIMLTILIFMIRRKQNPDIPRSPDSLINIALYLAGSNLVDELSQSHGNGGDQIFNGLSDKQFVFRWASGVDEKARWTVSALRSRTARDHIVG